LKRPITRFDDLHAELERRLKASSISAESSAYLFLLVRPDGITNYYRAQAAMQGLDVALAMSSSMADGCLISPRIPSDPVEPWMNTGAAPGAIAARRPRGLPQSRAATPPILYPRGFEGASAGTPHAGQPDGSGICQAKLAARLLFKSRMVQWTGLEMEVGVEIQAVVQGRGQVE